MSDAFSGPQSARPTFERPFTAQVRPEADGHLVSLAGGLDLETCSQALQACVAAEHTHVVVDLAELVFMDCAGYRALATSRSVLEARGGSLSLRHPRGEPLRMLSLVAPQECRLAA
jgi:anti-anti-sigma factor